MSRTEAITRPKLQIVTALLKKRMGAQRMIHDASTVAAEVGEKALRTKRR